MITYDRCPVCESTGIQKFLTATDHTVSHEQFEIWQCANCSLRFTQDVPEQNDIGRYYQSEEYISHTETSKGIVNRLYLFVRQFTLRSKENFIREQTGLKKGNLLDVGAGTGAFVHRMQTVGWQVTGLEPDEKAIQRAASQYGLSLQPVPSLFHLEPASFDAITLWHVLEHVHDLHGYMQQLKKLLKPSGKLFIAVPNYTSYDAECYRSDWAAYDVPRHLYHFSPAAMQMLVEKHGMTVQKMQPMWFDSFYVSMLSEKYMTGKSGVVKGFIRGLRSNSRALSNRRKASSLIYVIEKKE
jgi:2-polyprenyl-3-methyl-5-hydroxy-6-metoxy-1,4-benzoquinol methylase